MSKSQHAILRENFRGACEGFWRSIVENGWSAEHMAQKKADLCKWALRLHIFEQGMRAAKRERGAR